MIKLKLLGACENCANFNPVLADDLILTNLAGDTIYHTVTCKHYHLCSHLAKYLEKEAKKNGE